MTCIEKLVWQRSSSRLDSVQPRTTGGDTRPDAAGRAGGDDYGHRLCGAERKVGRRHHHHGELDAYQYKLTNSKPGKDAKGSTDAKNSTKRTYRLDAPDATISPEVGHQVEIVAVVVPETAGPVGTTGLASADAAPKLRVETIPDGGRDLSAIGWPATETQRTPMCPLCLPLAHVSNRSRALAVLKRATPVAALEIIPLLGLPDTDAAEVAPK